jgi:hypothetical protein
MDTYVNLGALGQTAVVALVAGAGIAVLFALGVRGLAMWTGDETDDGTLAVRRNPAGLALAVICFAIVAAIVVTGLYVMLTK